MERDAIEFESSGRAESPENVLGLSTTGDHRFNGAVTDQDIKTGITESQLMISSLMQRSQQKGLRGVLRIDPQGEYQLAFLLSELLNWLKKNSETIDHESKYIQVDKHKNVGDLMQPYMDHLAPLVRKKYSDV
ncbi:hypothetical protein H4Q26_013113 [Puccinia striiformis f. sp. tritici PST-130]|nr:hypothetical protein H4Q26_013113 [Puccinia striiformis f. sp. tritici PST-130]